MWMHKLQQNGSKKENKTETLQFVCSLARKLHSCSFFLQPWDQMFSKTNTYCSEMYMYLKVIIPQVTAKESCWNMDGRQAGHAFAWFSSCNWARMLVLVINCIEQNVELFCLLDIEMLKCPYLLLYAGVHTFTLAAVFLSSWLVKFLST